jgi:hypothetical protein
MFEFVYLFEAIVGLVKLKINYVDLVVKRVNIVRTHSHLELVIFARSESDTIVLEVALVSVDLFGFLFF